MTTLGDDYPVQQARCREILATYQSIGPAGQFGAMVIEQTLRDADRAATSGDVAAMLAAYESMKAIKE